MSAGLERGRWVPHRGTLIWDSTPTVAEVRVLRCKPTAARFDPTLLACECGATVTQMCRTSGGNPTVAHAYRVVSRRCPCGAVLEPRKQYCTPCRVKARLATYRDRELRKSTAQRRAAA